MKKTKQTLSIVLAVLMLVLSVPFAVAQEPAEPEVLLSGEYGTITWSLTDDGTLTIGGTGAIEPTSIDGEGEDAIRHYPWTDAIAAELGVGSIYELNAAASFAMLRETFKALVVEEGITSIGDEAFAELSFTTITLASTVASLGEGAIYSYSLENLTILNPMFSFEENDIPIFGFLGEESAFSNPDELWNWTVSFMGDKAEQLLNEIGVNYFQLAMTIAYGMYYCDAQTFEQMKSNYPAMAAQNYGISASSFDDLVATILNQFNTVLDTDFTEISQLFVAGKDPETGDDTVWSSPAIAVAMGTGSLEATVALFATEMITVNLGQSLYGIHFSDADPLTSEPWDDPSGPVTVYPWITVYGYEGSTAQAAAEASGVNFVALEDEPAETITLQDPENEGVSLTCEPDAFPEDAKVKVTPKNYETPCFLTGYDYYKAMGYDIIIYGSSHSYQPIKPCTVKIPIPNGYDTEHLKVFHRDPLTKRKTEIPISRIENGYVVIVTNKFSEYGIIDTTSLIGQHEHTYDFEDEITRTPTCIDPGERTCTCECGETDTREIGINAANHVNTENKDAVPSTCTVKGYTAGVYCNDCKQYVSGHEEQPLAAHTPGAAVKENEIVATEEHGGSFDEVVYCSVCGNELSRTTKTTDPLTPETPTDIDIEPDDNQPGLITRIIDWFRSLIARILGFFGIK